MTKCARFNTGQITAFLDRMVLKTGCFSDLEVLEIYKHVTGRISIRTLYPRRQNKCRVNKKS